MSGISENFLLFVVYIMRAIAVLGNLFGVSRFFEEKIEEPNGSNGRMNDCDVRE